MRDVEECGCYLAHLVNLRQKQSGSLYLVRPDSKEEGRSQDACIVAGNKVISHELTKLAPFGSIST